MKLLKYLGRHKGAVLLVLLLLCCQAFCDLMLPNYTAQIVDVGIQQSGVEHASPDELSAETFDALVAAVDGDSRAESSAASEGAWPASEGAAPASGETGDASAQASHGSAPGAGGEPDRVRAALAECYDRDTDSGTYRLNAYGRAHRAELDALVAEPIARRFGLVESGSTGPLVEQAGIAAARAEYEALGYDMGVMQMDYLLFTGLKMMGFVVLSALISILIGLVASRTGARIGRELRESLFAKVMSFSDAEIQRFSAASLITRATNDIQQIQMMSIMLMRLVLYAPILAAGGVIMIMRSDMSMGWVVAVAVGVLLAVVIALMVIAMPKFKAMQKLIDSVNLIAREMLTGVSVVRAFGQQQREQERFDGASTKLMRTQLFTNRVMTFMMPTMMMIMNVTSVVIVWVGAGQIDAGAIQTGDLIAFITYSMLIIMGFLMLGMLAIIAPRANVAAERIEEVLDAEASIADPENGSSKVAARSEGAADAVLDTPAREVGSESAHDDPHDAADLDALGLSDDGVGAMGEPGVEISFAHVYFAYDDGSEPVLSDVTFTAEAGKTCAIIGSTGSGKSTILKLVERFYDVDAGSVRVGGVDVRDMPLATLRSQLGYVPQHAFLFTGTIASNVGFAYDEVSEERIREAIEIAQASEFVDAAEDGLEREITQGGTNVSGGQRQRLAIARALATEARALLFDDSFSALDYKTDAALRRAFAERLAGKTQVIVAQRIATVMYADKIVVLDEGRVVGEGTHAELIVACPQYREIARSQLSPEELETDGSGAQEAGDVPRGATTGRSVSESATPAGTSTMESEAPAPGDPASGPTTVRGGDLR